MTLGRDVVSGSMCTQALHSKRVFLKGLAVVDDVAYFGIAPHAVRSARAHPMLDCALAAFDLTSRQLLWQRKVWHHCPFRWCNILTAFNVQLGALDSTHCPYAINLHGGCAGAHAWLAKYCGGTAAVRSFHILGCK